MNRIVDGLRSGGWLTRERIRGYALIIIGAHLLAIVLLVATAHHNIDYAGRPLGTDFSDVWTAGRLVLRGAASSAYVPATHYAEQQAVFAHNIPYFGWHYPPFFLLVAGLLATMPYIVALAVWQGATLPLYLATMRSIAPGPMALLVALAYPAVFINLTHGHNGFLSAALLGGGMVLLERRPMVAGVLLGLLVYKPQFGLFIPLALVVSGQWRAFAAAGVTVLLLAGLTTGLFGLGIWRAFLDNTAFTQKVVLEQGGAGFYKIQSAFAAVRMWGGPLSLAYGVQAVVTAAAAVAVTLLWRGQVDSRLRAAGLMTACLLGTPYCLDYDFMILAPAGAFLISAARERGFRPFEASLIAAVFAAPLFARGVALVTLVPLGLLATLGLFAIILTRAFDRRTAGEPATVT
jgi:hypothetical protein